MTFLPIVERELRVAARRGGTYWTRWLAAVGVMADWVVLGLAMNKAWNPQANQTLFLALGILALVFCLFAGIFLTADCISEEKRDSTLGLLFLSYSAGKLNQLSSRIRECVGKLSCEQVWQRGSTAENAVGNRVLHLCGNVRQWIGFGVAGKPDVRMRDREFAARGGIQPAELIERLESTVADALADLRSVTMQRLQERVKIQAYELSVLEAIYHVAAPQRRAAGHGRPSPAGMVPLSSGGVREGGRGVFSRARGHPRQRGCPDRSRLCQAPDRRAEPRRAPVPRDAASDAGAS